MRRTASFLSGLAAAALFATAALAAETPVYPGYDCAEGDDESVVTTDSSPKPRPTFTGV